MSDTLILWLPDVVDGNSFWQRIADDKLHDGGEDISDALGDFEAERIVAFAPAAVTGLGWVSLPELAPAQRDAAAAELARDWIAEPNVDVHLSAGAYVNQDGNRPVAWVSGALMREWDELMRQAGLKADAIVPAALLMPQGEPARAHFGAEDLLSANGLVWRDDVALNAALLAAVQPRELTMREIEAAILRAVDDPPLNLLTGRFGRRDAGELDAQWLRKMAVLALGALVVTLAIPVAETFRMDAASNRLKRESLEAVANQFPGTSDPQAAFQSALVDRGAEGAAFLPTANAVAKAATAAVGVELTGMRFQKGALDVSLRATRREEAEQLRQAIEKLGYSVEGGEPSSNQGGITQTLRVGAN